jgi:PleD family two-component response regulator
MADCFEQRLELKFRFCSVPKRILIADDHESVLRRIRAMLQDDPVWEICGDAVDGREAIEKAAKLEPDLVILDFAMPRLNGLQVPALKELLGMGLPEGAAAPIHREH